MMISGTNSKIINQQSYKGKCQYCGEENCVEIQVKQNYLHIFWIPFVPTKRVAVSVCLNCKNTLEGKELSEDYNGVFQRIKAESKTPIWMWSGLGLIALLIAFGVYVGNQNKEENLQLVSAPKIGDVYEFKTGNGNYTLAKVNSVKGDSVFLKWSLYETDKITGLSKIETKSDKSFTDASEGFTIKQLSEKMESGELVDIIR